MKLSDAVYGNLLEKNFEKALSVQNRYSFINANIFPILSKDEMELLNGFEQNCSKLVPDAHENKNDVYPMFPKLGEHRMIQRMNPFDGFEGSTKAQMLLSMATVQIGPQIDMAVVASGILVGNSLFHNPKRTDIQQKALEEIYKGTKVGGIGITEPERGSDAVNMQLMAKIAENGDITYNGTKIYTTNGAVADYLTTYGVTDETDPRRTMMLTLFIPDQDTGIVRERLAIPAAPAVGIAKVQYNGVTVNKERMVAPPGEGYKRLFRGLTPERIAIIGSSIAGVWGALSHGAIFSQIRSQFGKPLFKYQGITHVLGDIYAKAAAYTAFAFQIADFYDKKIAAKIHHGETPDQVDEGSVAVMASQGKYLAAKFAHDAAYEIVQTMGGRGALDEAGSNNGISQGENVSRISEVVGGHRNVQLMIMEMGLRGTTAMSLSPFIDKAKKEARKYGEKMTEMVANKAIALLASDGDKLGDAKAPLENCLAKLKEAKESKNFIELEAYAKALPKLFADASKAAYIAKKG
jgi:alkylation response protein AidB-like acyl-CoA dehydrogenase